MALDQMPKRSVFSKGTIILIASIVLVLYGLFRLSDCMGSAYVRPNPIFGFVEKGLFDSVKHALDAGTPIDTKYPDMFSLHGQSWYYQGETPLFYASAHGNLAIVTLLIARGADVNARSSLGNTPLMEAAYYHRTDVVSYLLDYGVDPDPKNDYGETPLTAAMGGYTSNLRIEGELVTTRDDTCIASLLVKRGADVNAKIDAKPHSNGDYGYTSLILACSGGKLHAAEFLLDHHADLEAKTNHGRTALLAAADGMRPFFRQESLSVKHLRVVQFLIARGANLSVKTNDGISLLMLAAAPGSLHLVQELISKEGFDPRAISSNGQNTLHFACMSKNLDLVRYLVEDLKMSVDSGGATTTVLGCAVAGGNIEIAKYLVAHGAQVNRRNSRGLTPLDEVYDDSTKAYLESLGAKPSREILP